MESRAAFRRTAFNLEFLLLLLLLLSATVNGASETAGEFGSVIRSLAIIHPLTLCPSFLVKVNDVRSCHRRQQLALHGGHRRKSAPKSGA